MRFSICRACILLALVLSLGLHWTVLQSAAWVGMVVSYSQEGTLGEALEKTFDGEHPCPLCKIIDRGTADQGGEDDSQDPKSSRSALKKIDLLAEASLAVQFFNTCESVSYPSMTAFASMRAQEPSVPPPQRV